jgi:uncharacterized protein with HEPN domain
MREAAEKAIAFAHGRTPEDLESDEMLRLALVKLVEIIGEAAKQVADETRTRFASVPWAEASRMRDRLVHHYFDIDLDVLWVTVTHDLPELVRTLPSIN